MYHYVGLAATRLLEAAMHTTVIRSAQSLGIPSDRTPSRWTTRLRSILSSRWHRKNEEAKRDGLYRLDDRLLADLGLYREHRIHNPESRTDRQPASPLPVALLAMWAAI
jgi:uncharacterized protein YjiS (DUF1127 family)